MSPEEELHIAVRRLRRRVRLLMAERYGLFGASAGALAASMLVLLSSRFESLISYPLWMVTVLLCALIGALYGIFKRVSDLAVAITADQRTGLKERVSTAVSLYGSPTPSDWETALVSDASNRISAFRPQNVFPHRYGLPHSMFGAALLILLIAVFLPQTGPFQSKIRKQEVAVMKQEGAKLVKIAKDIKKETGPTDKDLRRLAAKLDALGKRMQTGRMTRKQALLKTQRLTKDIREKQDKLAQMNSERKSLGQARMDLQRANEDIAAKAAQKVPSDKKLAELARKDGPLTTSERMELEQALAEYADPNSSVPIPSELAEALAKLFENEDYRKAMEILQKLSEKLAKGNMNKLDEEALRRQLEMLAKALENTDLDELAKQLRESAEKLAQMSPEELERLIKQLKEAELLAKAGGG
ncbi:MAG: hypothetical protein HYX78_14010 [Armatimonadetes bacterium]|nr:hypothetical protein [Armatimonadota bacterium]